MGFVFGIVGTQFQFDQHGSGNGVTLVCYESSRNLGLWRLSNVEIDVSSVTRYHIWLQVADCYVLR